VAGAALDLGAEVWADAEARPTAANGEGAARIVVQHLVRVRVRVRVRD
jgi:hypothetical protein